MSAFNVGLNISMAAKGAVEIGLSREQFVDMAGKLHDAHSKGYSQDVLIETMLEIIPKEDREEVRSMLRDCGLLP